MAHLNNPSSRSRRSLTKFSTSLLLIAAILLSSTGVVSAIDLSKPFNSVKETFKKIPGQTENLGKDVGRTFEDGARMTKEQLTATANGIGKEAWQAVRDQAIFQHSDLIKRTATNWGEIGQNNSSDWKKLKTAIRGKNNQETLYAFGRLAKNNLGLKALVENAQQKKVWLRDAIRQCGCGSGCGCLRCLRMCDLDRLADQAVPDG